MNRRELLRGISAMIGVGVVGKAVEVDAAPPVTPPVVQAQATQATYTAGSAYTLPRYSSLQGFRGSVSFSTDGVNWHELGKALSWDIEYVGGDE